MTSPVVVVVGSINQDVVLEVVTHPAPGETVLATGRSTGFGGKGGNQAVAAARAGARVQFVGAVGEDDAGRGARRNLDEWGVDTELISTVDAPTGTAYVTVSQDGENAIVVVGGANAQLTPADVDRVADALTGAGVVVAQMEVPLAVVERTVRTATRVILNVAPAQELAPDVLALVDVLIVNEGEARTLLGARAPADIDGLTAALCALGPGQVVVTLGARGAAWRCGQEAARLPAPPVDVVDTTGAGDAFVGAFAADFVTGASLAECVAAGIALAAETTTFRGAQPPRRP